MRIGTRFIGATGIGNQVVGGNDRASSEILLDKTLGYVVKITNTSASVIKAVLGIDWYRHN